MTRLIVSSAQLPPQKPVIRPRQVPATIPSSVASGAMLSVSDAPASTREKTSRPSWSVPNQCAELGGASTDSLCPSGSSGVRCAPTSPQKTQNATMMLPRMKVFERASWASISRRAICASVGTKPRAGSMPAASSIMPLIRRLRSGPGG